MEPLFFKAENLPEPGSDDRDAGASMEPLFLKAENPMVRDPGVAQRIAASMEPLFFKAENSCVGIFGGCIT